MAMENFKYQPSRIQHVPGQEGRVNHKEKARIMAEIEDQYQTAASMYQTYLTKPAEYTQKYPLMDAAVERYIDMRTKAENEQNKSGLERAQQVVQKAQAALSGDSKGIQGKEPLPNKNLLELLSADPAVKKYLADEEEYLNAHPTSNKTFDDFQKFEAKGIMPDYIRTIGEVAAESEGFAEDYASAGYVNVKELKRSYLSAEVQFWFNIVKGLLAARQNPDAGDFDHNPEYYNAQTKMRMAKAVKEIIYSTFHPEEEDDEGMPEAV